MKKPLHGITMAVARILIVEDESIISLHLQRALEMRGYEIAGKAATGEDAVRLAAECRPDLILMDIILEGDMDGVAAVSRIKAERDVPVLYVTAHSDEATLHRAKETNPYGYILKPVNHKDLYSAIEIALYRHSIEKKLFEREEKYRSLVESINDVVFSLDEKGIMSFIGPQIEHMAGYQITDIIGSPMMDFIFPGDRSRLAGLFEKYRCGHSEVIEFRIMTRAGEILWVNASSKPVIAEGRFLGIRGILSNINDRKQEDERANVKTKRLQRQQSAMIALATMPGLYGMEIVDALKSLTEIAAAALAVTRFSVWFFNDEGTRMDCIDCYCADGGTHEAGESIKVDRYPNYFRAVSTSRAVAADEAAVNPCTAEFADEYFRPRNIVATLDAAIRHKGRQIGVIRCEHSGDKRSWFSDEIVFASEIADFIDRLKLMAERRDSEREVLRLQGLLHAAIEQSPSGILVADAPDVTIRLANQAALAIRGESDRPLTQIPLEHHPANWRVFYPGGEPYSPEDLPLSRAVLKGETSRNVEAIIRRASGEDRWVLTNAAPVRDASGEIIAGVVVFTDITDRKEMEGQRERVLKALQNSEERYALAMEATDEGLWDWSLADDSVYYSPRWFSMLGYPGQERFSNFKELFNFAHPDDIDGVLMAVRRAIDSGSDTGSVTLRLRTASGDWRWIMARGRVVQRDAAGQPVRIVGTNVDIHDRVQAERSLRESEERSRVIIEQASLGIVTFSPGGTFHQLNRQFCDMTGYEREELLNRNYTSFIRQNDMRPLMEYFRKAVSGATHPPLRVHFMNREGTAVPLMITLSALYDSSGDLDRVLCIAHSGAAGNNSLS